MNVLQSQTILVTGANGGLGLETCKHLIDDGVAKIFLACRTMEKAIGAREALLAHAGSSLSTHLVPAGGFDMTDPLAIREAVAALDFEHPLDIVFLQAGGVVFGSKRKHVHFNGQNVERTVFQNVVGAHVTLMALLDNGAIAKNARVVFAGGEGARGLPGLIESPKISLPSELRHAIFEDEQQSGEDYVDMNAMGISKFVGALWVQKIAELYVHQMSVVWFTPGLTAGTNGLAGVGSLKKFIAENIGFPLMVLFGKAQTPSQGARKFADCLEGKVGKNGELLGAPKDKALGALQDQIPMHPGFSDASLRDALWDILGDVCGVSDITSRESSPAL
ncbi:MAG: SDR family NAD(P)-dependent oxidoreductase [Deltaproteobacteria bacterium]|nr:SDR family NAD(P)-dependent oxidoreductase [Deltaproteobacteria bacterium]